MRFYSLFSLVSSSLLFCLSAFAQQPSSTQVIPFRLTNYNNLIFNTLLNQQDSVALMLHTAASDVILTEAAVEKAKTLKFEEKITGAESWGGGGNDTRFSKNNTLQIGDFKWEGLAIWEDVNSGQESGGKFGLSLFKGKILTLDFDKKQLTVGTKLPRKLKKYEKFPLVVQGDELFLKATCWAGKDSFQNLFLIHSGYGGAILLDDAFVQRSEIGKNIVITGEKKLQDAYGNVITTKKGLLTAFQLGKQQLNNAPVGFFEGNIGGQSISIMGGDLLKRFNWVIDLNQGYVYLKPNRLFYEKFSAI